MALQNHPALYTGGAVSLDSTPFVNFQTKLLAMKQAKDEALDEYYNKLNQSVNPAGVRTQDLPAFNEKVAGWRNFYLQNKDDIKRGGQSQLQYQQMLQDIQGYITQSKNEAEKVKPIIPMLIDPEKRERVTPNFMQSIASHDLPLTDPNRKSIDLNSATFNPKEYNTADWDNYWKGLNSKVKRDKTLYETRPHPTDKFRQIDVTTEEYSPQKLKDIGDIARDNFFTDDNLQYSFIKSHPFTKWKDENAEVFKQLDGLYKTVYGKDAAIQDEDDLFAAMAIQKNAQPTITEKPVDNWEERQKLMQENKRINISLNSNSGGSGGAGGVTTGNALDTIPDTKFGNFFTKDGIFYEQDGTPKNGRVFITASVLPAAVRSVLKSGGIDPQGIGKGVDAVIKDGYIQSISNKKIGTLTREVLEGVYQPKFDTEPQKGQKLQFNPNKPSPKAQPTQSKKEMTLAEKMRQNKK